MTTDLLGKYSFGVGDRFAQQGEAQLAAIRMAQERGIDVTPVWNKSHREHTIAKTEPIGTRRAADAAVAGLGWTGGYFVDADHVTLETVGRFLDCSDYFTIDVADAIGRPADPDAIGAFVERFGRYVGTPGIPGVALPCPITAAALEQAAGRYLQAVREAGVVYRRIREAKGGDGFIVEVSMDEAASAQTPLEMLLILAAMAEERIPVRAVAPKFSGRFNKGVDYVGDVGRFGREFEELLAVLRFAVGEFGLPEGLKISVHTGSDKFSIYPVIGRAIRRHDAGIHLKTAGTTWLEELIGLASSGAPGLGMAKDIYAQSLARLDALVADYTAVIDIDPRALPPASDVRAWDGPRFAAALRHDQGCPHYNPHFRQLLHVGFKIAAEMGDAFLGAVRDNAGVIGANVTENIFSRHLLRLFAD